MGGDQRRSDLAERRHVHLGQRAQRLGTSLHYSADGKLLRQITNGNWEVRSIEGVDEANGFIYFTSTEHSPIANNGYRIKLDGTGLTRITTTEGSHRVDVSPAYNYFIDFWSDLNTPSQVRLYD